MKFSFKNFLSYYDQIWPHLLNKCLMENFFCGVNEQKKFVTKGHKYLNKLAVKSFRFVKVLMTFCYHIRH